MIDCTGFDYGFESDLISNLLKNNLVKFDDLRAGLLPQRENIFFTAGLNFGSLFEIKSATDELFINGATVDDIEIITGITSSAIKSVSGTTIPSTVTSQQSITSSTYGVSNG
jgi:hypothetical protein